MQIAVWLWFTVLFANFAEAIAEGRGKAQAATLRRTQSQAVAKRLDPASSIGWQQVPATQLRVGDVVIVVGYNSFPTVAGAGSAIFLHIARKTFSPTVGCIAIEREALLQLLPLLGPESRLRIEG